MLSRLRNVPSARIDVTYGIPDLEAVRTAAQAGDREALGRAVATCEDADDRSDAVAVAATVVVDIAGVSVPEWVAGWTRAEPENAIAWTVSGAVEVLRAWKVRGYHRARATAGSALMEFRKILDHAELMCRRASELDPDDPIPWVWLVHMARGQEVGFDETVRRWAELSAVAPQHLRGHHQMLLSVSPKWGYPGEVMEEFVKVAVGSAPDGSALNLLAVAAYVEHWCQLPDAQARDFVRAETTAAGARAAISRWLHPNGSDPRGVVSGHNLAAFWYSLRGESDKAGPHFEMTRGYCDHFPWGYLDANPLASYKRYRRKAR